MEPAPRRRIERFEDYEAKRYELGNTQVAVVEDAYKDYEPTFGQRMDVGPRARYPHRFADDGKYRTNVVAQNVYNVQYDTLAQAEAMEKHQSKKREEDRRRDDQVGYYERDESTRRTRMY